jgi:probable DNA metabolism protein
VSLGLAYRVRIAPEFAAWRDEARRLLRDGIEPDQIELVDEENDNALTLGFAQAPEPSPRLAIARPGVSKAFLDLAEIVACHSEPERWQILYRVLWRLQNDRSLMKHELDEDIARMRRMDQQVRRDLHKMHAFLRFRMVEEAGREHYIAWYRPDHRILPLAVPFFVERFAVMQWTILTDHASASWDPTARRIAWGPGVPRSQALAVLPENDELESMWRSYYGSIFNPARLNTRAMRSEMPVRYWANLPELQILPQLLNDADRRVGTMMEQQSSLLANTYVPELHTLPILREALPRCEGCDLYKPATQAVFGAGLTHAPMMLVGEQPGDAEDRAGAPFVGPAGKVLDQIVEELGFDRKEMYVTNAVKHFKFVERGKRRIHESPNLREITACRPWLLAELDAVQPRVVVCLGASAAKSLLGAKFALMKDRGKVVESPYARHVIATIHPSAVLRAEGDSKRVLYEFIKQDLLLAEQIAMREAS